MNYHFRKIVEDGNQAGGESEVTRPIVKRGFTLIEVVVALAILSLICTSVLIVFERSLNAAADSNQRMRAFEIARENMEKLLATDSVSEMSEYGTSTKYPDIKWQRTVEAFYEPITNRMWLRGVCSAEYTDSSDKREKVELTHWLADLTREQIMGIIQQRALAQVGMMIFQGLDEAAEHAEVELEIIQEWIGNGMALTENGFLTIAMVDLFKQASGKPAPEAVEEQKESDKLIFSSLDLSPVAKEVPSDELSEPKPSDSPASDGTESDTTKDVSDSKPESPGAESPQPSQPKGGGKTYVLCGRVYTNDDFKNMSMGELMSLLYECL